jgi:hypothetical protein
MQPKKVMHPTGEGTGPLDHEFASDDFPDLSIFLHFDPSDPCFFMPDEIVPMIVRCFIGSTVKMKD